MKDEVVSIAESSEWRGRIRRAPSPLDYEIEYNGVVLHWKEGKEPTVGYIAQFPIDSHELVSEQASHIISGSVYLFGYRVTLADVDPVGDSRSNGRVSGSGFYVEYVVCEDVEMTDAKGIRLRQQDSVTFSPYYEEDDMLLPPEIPGSDICSVGVPPRWGKHPPIWPTLEGTPMEFPSDVNCSTCHDSCLPSLITPLLFE